MKPKPILRLTWLQFKMMLLYRRNYHYLPAFFKGFTEEKIWEVLTPLEKKGLFRLQPGISWSNKPFPRNITLLVDGFEVKMGKHGIVEFGVFMPTSSELHKQQNNPDDEGGNAQGERVESPQIKGRCGNRHRPELRHLAY